MLGSIAVYAAARLSAGIFFLGSAYIYVHSLGAHDYGVFAVAIATAQVAALLSFGWLWYSSTRFMSGVDEDTARARLRVLVSTLAVCALATIALIILSTSAGALEPCMKILTPTIVFGIGVGLNEFLLGLSNARRDFRGYVVVSMTRYGLSFCLGLLMVPVLGWGVSGALWAMALGVFGSLLLPRSLAIWAPVARNFVPDVSKEFWTYFYSGWSSALIFGMFSLTVLTNRLAVDALAGSEMVGLLSGVTDLVNAPAVILFQILNLVFAPQVYAAANRGETERLRATCREFLTLQLVIGFTSSVAFLMLGPALSGLLIGDSLGREGGRLFGPAGVYSIVVAIYSMAALLLIASSRMKTVLGVTVAVLLLNVPAVILARGDVVTTVAASAGVILVGTVTLIGLSMRIIGYRFGFRELAMTLVCTATTALAIQLHREWAPIGGAVGSLVIGGAVALLVCGAFDALGIRTRAKAILASRSRKEAA